MAVGLVLRSAAPGFALFVAGSVLAMAGGALGNVLLPSLVKRHFPHRTGLLVGTYSFALGLGGAFASVITQPIAAAVGEDGWRWALAVWAVPALLAALTWLAVPATPGASRAGHVAVRMRPLVHSPLALALTAFFGVQAIQAYVVIGWLAQYLRDSGLDATTAGWMLGITSVIVLPISAVVPALTVQPRRQRPLLAFFMSCYALGWTGLWVAPLAAPWLWAALLGIGMGTFPMVLTFIGLRARTPETTAALSTVTQGWGYVVAAGGPLLVGVLRGATGGYTGMFVLVLGGVAALTALGWVVTRERYVDDEVERSVPGWAGVHTPRDEDVVEAAGCEAPVTVHVTEPAAQPVTRPVTGPGGGSPRG
jgi:CP family cyanate transporter-like MFS transporter